MGVAGVAAYGALGLPLAFAALPVYVHVPRLYGEVVGMNLAVLGGALLLARIADAVVDPLLGRWSDRSANRRILILAGLPLFAAGFLMLLQPPPGAGLAWLLPALAATYFGFSLSSVAYQAWGAELGGGSLERTRLTASREAFGLVGVILASVLPFVLAAELGPGLARTSVVFLPLLLLATLALLLAPGRALAPSAPVVTMPPLGACLRDRRFVRLLGVFVANGIAAALPATLVLFYVSDVLAAPGAGGWLLVIYFVAGAAGLPLWIRAAVRIGRVRAWALSMLASIAVFSWTPFLGAGDLVAFAVVCGLSGIALGADLMLPAALLADLTQAPEKRGAAQAGSYFGWWNLVAKANLAVAAAVSLPLLQVIGYVPGAGAGAGLAWAYGGLPVVFKIVALALLWRWRHHLEDRR